MRIAFFFRAISAEFGGMSSGVAQSQHSQTLLMASLRGRQAPDLGYGHQTVASVAAWPETPFEDASAKARHLCGACLICGERLSDVHGNFAVLAFGCPFGTGQVGKLLNFPDFHSIFCVAARSF